MATNQPFQAAHRTFLDSLSPEDRAKLDKIQTQHSTADDVVKTLRSIDGLARQKQGLLRCLGFFKDFNDRLKSYFDALNVVAGTQDCVAAVYGSLRIIIQVSFLFCLVSYLTPSSLQGHFLCSSKSS
jgi:hypothetical protein